MRKRRSTDLPQPSKLCDVIDLRPVTLRGRGVILEPLTPEHASGLKAAASDGELWKLPYTSVPAHGETERYIERALEGQHAGTMLPWAVRDEESGAVIGSTRYHDIAASIDRVEIGYTWYAHTRWATRVNPACKLLLLEHAFGVLGCAVVGLRTDGENLRSQAAIERLGARRDGLLRHFGTRRDGSARDTVMFSILRDEWPAVKTRLLERLAEVRA